MINFSETSQKGKIREILNKKGAKIYFIGIGGVSMSSLAILMKKRGMKVSGSDIRTSEITDILKTEGIGVRLSHAKESVMAFGADIVVYSLAVDRENPEYRAAMEIGALTVSRAELLGAVMEDFKTKLGISGSHGKSTVSAFMGSVLDQLQLNPTVLCGAEISSLYGLKEGTYDYLVYEACEYGDSFLKLEADVQILLNLELDHTDYFKTLNDIKASFLRCANNAKRSCVLNFDCANLRDISNKITKPIHTFSKRDGAEYKYDIVKRGKAMYSFKLFRKTEFIGEYFPAIRGEFNVQNAVAVAVTADVLGMPSDLVAKAISSFKGIKRRLELIKQTKDFDVFYDYAHHPSEIAASYSALSEMGYQNITVIFAPHTYTRTASFFDLFAKELAKFNTVYISEIYGAREKAMVGVNSTALASAVSQYRKEAHAVCANESLKVVSAIKTGGSDCVVLMGAGELYKYKEEFMKM